MLFFLISPSERKDRICENCKTDKSVKYKIFITKKAIDPTNGEEVKYNTPHYYCNKCILKVADEIEKEMYKETNNND